MEKLLDRITHWERDPVEKCPGWQDGKKLVGYLRKVLFSEYLARDSDVQYLVYEVFRILEEQMDPAIAAAFVQQLPEIRCALRQDLQAALAGDPAAESIPEILLAYPGFFAVTAYRLAHGLWELGVPLLPRLMAEYAHSATGIDIHPGARIGSRFFIDHGTGVVIGQTAVIGSDVKLYQGVTLGGMTTRGGQELKGVKRHPTVEDGVTIYANATVLGGETVIGRGSVIGANAFITESVAPGSRVSVEGGSCFRGKWGRKRR